jgi:hypothetical protein
MMDCDDFQLLEDEKRQLCVRFSKQQDGEYQCMAKMADGTRCETKGNVKDIRACVKKHRTFKELDRSRLIFLVQEKEIIIEKV